jgi:hypothetical protein
MFLHSIDEKGFRVKRRMKDTCHTIFDSTAEYPACRPTELYPWHQKYQRGKKSNDRLLFHSKVSLVLS